MNFKYNTKKLSDLSNDYSIFHPSVKQVKILHDLGGKFSEKTGISEHISRHIFISSYVEAQQEKEIFHYSVEEDTSVDRLTYAELVHEKIMEKLLDLLKDPKDETMRLAIKTEVGHIFDYYTNTYAKR